MFGKKFFLVLLVIIIPLSVLVNFQGFSRLITLWMGEEMKAIVTSTRISTYQYRCRKGESKHCSMSDQLIIAQTADGNMTNIEIEVDGELFSKIKDGDVITYLQLGDSDPVLKGDTSKRAQILLLGVVGSIAMFLLMGIYFAKNEKKLRKLRGRFLNALGR